MGLGRAAGAHDGQVPGERREHVVGRRRAQRVLHEWVRVREVAQLGAGCAELYAIHGQRALCSLTPPNRLLTVHNVVREIRADNLLAELELCHLGQPFHAKEQLIGGVDDVGCAMCEAEDGSMSFILRTLRP